MILAMKLMSGCGSGADGGLVRGNRPIAPEVNFTTLGAQADTATLTDKRYYARSILFVQGLAEFLTVLSPNLHLRSVSAMESFLIWSA